MPSLTDKLVNYVAGAKYEDLPRSLTEVNKKHILDALACIIAGSSADGIQPLVKLSKGWGGKKESTILVHGGKVPAPNAAMANCTMGRARDFGPHQPVIPIHSYETGVPVQLILAEYSKLHKHRAISGKDFILAIILGAEVQYRLRLAPGLGNLRRGWVTNTYAPIAMAAAGGKLLGFDEKTIRHAMGLAYAQTCCNMQANSEGSIVTRLHQGFGGKAGVFSVILADNGLTGTWDMLEGKYGFFSVYHERSLCRMDELSKGLGTSFEGSEVCTKLYPCCGLIHGAIDLVLDLAKEHPIKAGTVDKVIVTTSQYNYTVCGLGPKKLRPEIVPDAQFSYYYSVAAAILKGRVGIEDFTPEAIADPETLVLAQKVQIVTDPEKDAMEATVCPTDLEIRTRDGKSYKGSVEFFRGHPRNPVTFEVVANKLRDCTRFSASPLSKEKIDKLISAVKDLEKLDDVTTVLEYLV